MMTESKLKKLFTVLSAGLRAAGVKLVSLKKRLDSLYARLADFLAFSAASSADFLAVAAASSAALAALLFFLGLPSVAVSSVSVNTISVVGSISTVCLLLKKYEIFEVRTCIQRGERGFFYSLKWIMNSRIELK